MTMLGVDGPGAEAFLQAQLMNDVSALAERHWQWNGWLTPKGRVIALFALVRTAPASFLIVLPDFPADELRLALQRFVFRAKVTLLVRDDLRAAAAFDFEPAGGRDAADGVVGNLETGLCLDWSGQAAPSSRGLLLLPAASPLLVSANAATDARWLTEDLAHGLPRLPPSQRDAWTPQMLSLARLKAFSLKKGCYPGQEIVARTHYLGQAKRHLVAATGSGLTVGAELRDPEGKPAGTVICVSADGLTGLAVVAAAGPAELAMDGRPVSRRDLLDGLQRPV